MKKWYRILASFMAMLMLVSTFTFEGGLLFEASALRNEVERNYTVGKTIDYDSVFSSAYIIVPNLDPSTSVTFTYRGRAVSEAYDSGRHFATVAEAVEHHKTVGTANPVFYLCPGTYSSSRLYFPENAIVLGANAGVTPNASLNFDLPDVTKGWDAASRYTETVITIGIGGSGNIVIDGVKYNGTSNFYIASDNNSKVNSKLTVTLQNSILSGFVSGSKYFDTAAAINDEFGFDIKECRITDSAATAPFISNTRFIHTDGVYFTNITGYVVNTSNGFTPYEFSLDFYRTYIYKCATSSYGFVVKYSNAKHKTSLVFDKFLWYEGGSGAFGFITFYTTSDAPGTSHSVDIINSTFLADKSYIDVTRNTLINGNQSEYQLGTYTINFNNNRVIGFGSMFPNVGGQAGTQRIHADFNNNYFASSFTSTSDTSSLRSEYHYWTEAHGTNEFNNIDYARIDDLNYYTDYALTTSTRDFYASGVSFFENVDYVSIDNVNMDIYVGMREGTVSNPAIIFENSGVSAELYKTHSNESFSSKITSFSAPSRGSSVTYHFKCVKDSVTTCFELHVYGEDALPTFSESYSDPTGTLSSSAYLLYSGSATSGTVTADVDGKTYNFTLGTNAFKTVAEIFTAAGDAVPEIFVPYGEYGSLNLTKPCKIVGQNRRGSVYTSLDGTTVRGSDWINGKSASFSSVTVGCDGVSFAGITFTGTLSYSQTTPVTIKNCEFAGTSYIQLASGTESLNLSGLGITSTASSFITGALPSVVDITNCYFESGTPVTALTWSTDQASGTCRFNVDFCRFDNVKSTVISDVRRGVAADDANITMNVTNNTFNVTDTSKYAVNLKPAYYNSLVLTDNTFVSTSDSGAPLYLDTSASIDSLQFARNRFVGFDSIVISDTSIDFDGSYNYFAPYSEDYEVADNGTAIPGEIYCSYYYEDYTLTSLKPSVTGYEFSDNFTVSGDLLTLVTSANVTDITKEITAECAYMLWDENGNEVDATALSTEYDVNIFKIRFYNQYAPCNRIDYKLKVVRKGSQELTFNIDYGTVIRNENGVYVITLPTHATGTSFSVVGFPTAQLSTGGNTVSAITDIREGESRDYIVTVNGIKHRLHVTIPLSSGVYIDYDAVLNTAYIIGADKSDSEVSFWYRGETVTQTYDSSRHFDTFEEAYASFLAGNPDIILSTPVFIFAPGNYSAISLKYRAIILGANAGITPVSSATVTSTPYTVPALNTKRSDDYATTFYGSFTRAADDGTITTAENTSGNLLTYYTVIDGVDIHSSGTFFNESDYRNHYLSLQNITSVSPLTSGGGVGELTVKNAYIHDARAVTEMTTDKLTVDGSYITDTRALFDGANSVVVKKNFIKSCPTDVAHSGTGSFTLENNIISDVYSVSTTGVSQSYFTGNTISGGLPIEFADTTVVDGNRFIGYDTVNAKILGKNYVALNFKDENDLIGLSVGEDYYYDYKMTLCRSDFNLAGVSFDEGVHNSKIDNDGAVVKLILTDENEHAVTFIPATNGITATVNADKISVGNSYMLTLSKGGYQRQFTVITVLEDVPFFTNSKGYGDIKNTAIMIDPESLLFNGEGGIIEWKGQTYKYVYGQNLFTSAAEAREAVDGHLQLMLPAHYFDGEFVIPADCSVYGVNFDVNPNVQSDTLGDDWAKNDAWGEYGETEILNVSVPREAAGTLVEMYGITLRGRIWDGYRATSSLCTEFNMVNTIIEHLDWVDTIYGGTSQWYTITLTNSNSTSGRNNIDRGMIKNMRVEAIRANTDVSGAKNRFLNERLPQTFTIDGLYLDMQAAQCSLFGWMKMSNYQQDGVFTMKNSNLRNAMAVSTTANFSMEGRNHKVVRTGESVIANVENCTFYNMQAKNRPAISVATQAYSEVNIKDNLFISTSTPAKPVIAFTSASTLTNSEFNLDSNRFIGTRSDINFVSDTTVGTLDLSANYYAAYSADYQNVVSSSSLTGTNAVCNSYYTDYNCNFLNSEIAPYSFGNGIDADYENKTLSITLPSSHGTTFNIANYIVNNGGHAITCTLNTLADGDNTGTVTVANTDVYSLTVHLVSVKDELAELCTTASALIESEDFAVYTEASQGALRRELVRAQTAINRNADATKLNALKADLTKALESLVIDKSELDAIIATVPDNADGRYSTASYDSLMAVVNAVNSLDSTVTLKELERYKFDLRESLSALVDVREYNAALETAQAVADNGIYPSQAVAMFKNRIQNIADTVVLNSDIDVQRAVMLINNAYAYLTKDCVALNSAIEHAQSLVKNDYTVTSYNNVIAALEKANAINEDSYQAEIDNAASELKLALDNVISMSDFNKALTKALEVTNDDQYESAAWTAYTEGLDAIKAKSFSFVSRDDVLNGISDIALLGAGLVTDPSDLANAQNRYKDTEKNKSTYTSASFSVAEAAYNDTLKPENISDAQKVADAAAKLNNALDSLVTKVDATAKITALKSVEFDDSYCANTVEAYFTYVNGLVEDSAISPKTLTEWQTTAAAIAKKHSYNYVSDNNATCLMPSTETGTCQCGATDIRTVDGSALGHKYGEYAYNYDATFIHDGTKTATCERCGGKHTVVAEGTMLTISLQDTSKTFTDVKAEKWYKDAVDYTYSYGLISGMSNTEFGLNTEITRGMFITILARIAGVDTSSAANKKATQVFDDVKVGKYYSAAIEWAYNNKVVAGIDDKNFAPDKAIERQQLCVMIVNYAKLDGVVILPSEAAVTFNDSLTISNYAREAVSLCQRADIVNGYVVEDGVEFRAKNTATRAEAAQILYKFHKNFVIAK